MKLEQQVCSLELAQKLKELGVKQDSTVWWMRQQAGIRAGEWKLWVNSTPHHLPEPLDTQELVSAFTQRFATNAETEAD
jgi:uncharacterized membrane protein